MVHLPAIPYPAWLLGYADDSKQTIPVTLAHFSRASFRLCLHSQQPLLLGLNLIHFFLISLKLSFHVFEHSSFLLVCELMFSLPGTLFVILLCLFRLLYAIFSSKQLISLLPQFFITRMFDDFYNVCSRLERLLGQSCLFFCRRCEEF